MCTNLTFFSTAKNKTAPEIMLQQVYWKEVICFSHTPGQLLCKKFLRKSRQGIAGERQLYNTEIVSDNAIRLTTFVPQPWLTACCVPASESWTQNRASAKRILFKQFHHTIHTQSNSEFFLTCRNEFKMFFIIDLHKIFTTLNMVSSESCYK